MESQALPSFEPLMADNSHQLSLIGDEMEDSQDVSDVMSPEQKALHRLEPVGTNSASSPNYVQRSIPGQEEESYVPRTTSKPEDDHSLSQHALNDLAHDLSYGALQVALSELSTDEGNTDNDSSNVLAGRCHGAGDGQETELSPAARGASISTGQISSLMASKTLTSELQSRADGQESMATPANRVPSSLKSQTSSGNNHGSSVLTEYSVRETSDESGVLSQAEITKTPDSLPVMLPVNNTKPTVTPDGLSLTQYPMTDSSLGSTGKKDEDPAALSQYPLKGISPEQKSETSPDMAMYQNRPGTVIERPVTDGHNDEDDKNITVRTAYNKTGDSVISHASQGDMESTKSSGFDHSIKFPQQNQTIGDSFFGEKKPISSSTPNRESDVRGSLIGKEQGGEEDWSLKKLPISEYMSTDERAKMLGASFSTHKISPRKDEEEVVKDMATRDNISKSSSTRSLEDKESETRTMLTKDLIGENTEISGRVSDPRSLRSTGSLEQFTFEHSRDTSVWSSTRTSMERDGLVEERSTHASARTTPNSLGFGGEGITSMLDVRLRSPKETLERIAASSPVSMSGLGLSRENASLDLYKKSGKKGGSSSASSTSSSSSAPQRHERSGTDSMLMYDGRDRHSSNGSLASAEIPVPRLASSAHSEASNVSNQSKRSASFQALIPSESILTDVTKASDRFSVSSQGSNKTSSTPLTLEQLEIRIDRSGESLIGSGASLHQISGSGEKVNILQDTTRKSSSIHSGRSSTSSNKSKQASDKRSRQSTESLEQGLIPQTNASDFYTITPGAEALGRDSSVSLPGGLNVPSDVKSNISSRGSRESLQKSDHKSSFDSIYSASGMQQATQKPSPTDVSKDDNQASSKNFPVDFANYLKPSVMDDELPSSKRSSLGSDADSKRSSLSLGATAESLNKVETLSDRVNAILKDGTNQNEDAQSVDSDVERITGEYQALLQGISGKIAPGESSENLPKATGQSPHVPRPEVMIESIDPQDVPSGSETDDTLDRDVKRILAKYGRHLSDEEAVAKIEVPGKRNDRVSPTGSCDTDDTLSHRVQNLLLKSADLGSTIGGSTSVPAYLYDDPARSMTLPTDLGSTTSSVDTLPTPMGNQTVMSPKSATDLVPQGKPDSQQEYTQHYTEMEPSKDVVIIQDKPVYSGPSQERGKSMDRRSSSDSLHKKVSQILSNTSYLGGSDSSLPTSGGSSRSPSRASSVDYKALSDDLNELEVNLEVIKSTNNHDARSPKKKVRNSLPSAENSQLTRSIDNFTPSASNTTSAAPSVPNSQYSTPKKFTWDHGADIDVNEEGRFVSASTDQLPQKKDSDEKKKEQKSSPQKQYYSMPLSPLLTHGVVPMDVALDILHGRETKWKPQSVAELDAMIEIRSKSPAIQDQDKMISGQDYQTPSTAHHSPSRRRLIDDFDKSKDLSAGNRSSMPRQVEPSPLPPLYQLSPIEQQRRKAEEQFKPKAEHQRYMAEQQRRTHDPQSTIPTQTVPPVRNIVHERTQEHQGADKFTQHANVIQQPSTRYPDHPDEIASASARSLSDPPSMSDSEDTDVAYQKLQERLRREDDFGSIQGTEDSQSLGESTPRSIQSTNFKTLTASDLQPLSQGPSNTSFPPRKETHFSNYQIEIDERGNRSRTPVNLESPASTATPTPASYANNQTPSDLQTPIDSFNTTPVPHQPFKVFGNMQNLFVSQRDRASASQFDHSVELRSPVKHQLESVSDERLDMAMDRDRERYELSGGYSTETMQSSQLPPEGYYHGYSTETLQSSNRYPLQSGFSAESLQERTLTPAVTEAWTEDSASETDQRRSLTTDQLIEKYVSNERRDHDLPPQGQGMSRQRTSYGDMKPSTEAWSRSEEYSRGEQDRYGIRDTLDANQASHVAHESRQEPARPADVSNTSSRPPASSPNLRPYRPPGSNELYYVEATDDNQSITTDATVESTHTGSDDARGPLLPSHVYGSRAEPPRGAVGVYGSRKTPPPNHLLGTIPEMSYDSRDTDPGKHSSHSSKRSSSDSKKSQKSEDKERSFTKARDWVNGTYPSKEDVRAQEAFSKKGDMSAEKGKDTIYDEYRQLPNARQRASVEQEKVQKEKEREHREILERERLARKKREEEFQKKEKEREAQRREREKEFEKKEKELEIERKQREKDLERRRKERELQQLEMELEKERIEKENADRDRRIDERIQDSQVAEEIRLSRRAAEIRKRFQEFTNQPVDSVNVDREISDSRYQDDDSRKKYEQKFGTPKKSARSTPNIEESKLKSSENSDANKKSSSPVDLHKLPLKYDIRNDRYNAASPSHSYMGDTSFSRPRTRSPQEPGRRSKSPGVSKNTSRSGRSTPSPSRSPDRYNELDTITSFDKHYAKIDRYTMDGRSRSPSGRSRSPSGRSRSPSGRSRSPGGRSRSPKSYQQSQFSPLEPTQDDDHRRYRTTPHPRDLLGEDGSPLNSGYQYQDEHAGDSTANTSSLMKYANSFVTSSIGGAVSSRSPQSARSYREMSSSPVDTSGALPPSPPRGMDSLAASTISPYSTATDRFQHSQSPSRFSPQRSYASPQYSKHTDRYGRPTAGYGLESESLPAAKQPSRDQAREYRGHKVSRESPGVPDNLQELWEKFQDHQKQNSDTSDVVAKIAEYVKNSSGEESRDPSFTGVREKVEKQAENVREREMSQLTREDLSQQKSKYGQVDYRDRASRDLRMTAQSSVSVMRASELANSLERDRYQDLKEKYGDTKDLHSRDSREELSQRKERVENVSKSSDREVRKVVNDQKASDGSSERKAMPPVYPGRERQIHTDSYDRDSARQSRDSSYRRERETEQSRDSSVRKQRDAMYKNNGANNVKQNDSRLKELDVSCDRYGLPEQRKQTVQEVQTEQSAGDVVNMPLPSAVPKQKNLDDRPKVPESGDSLPAVAKPRDQAPPKDDPPRAKPVPTQEESINKVPSPRQARQGDDTSTNQSYQQDKSSMSTQQQDRKRYSSGRESDPGEDSRDHRRNERGGGGGGGRDPNDPNRDSDKRRENRQRDTSTEEEADDSRKEDYPEQLPLQEQPVRPKKMAWVIKDETLLSIPEDSTLDSVSSDFTTSSEIDSDGKQITRTTKRHLPADPKLLKLQQKIAKQKEKYRREWIREQKRKEKIKQLEEMLIEKGGGHAKYRRRHYESMDSSTTFSSTGTFEDSATLTQTDITETQSEASTLQDSNNETRNTYTVTDVSHRSSPNKDSYYEDSRSYKDVKCTCHHKSHPAVRKSPPKKHQYDATSPKLSSIRKHTQYHSHSPPKRQKLKTLQEPIFQLKQVDYNRTEPADKRSKYRGTYMEFETPKSNTLPKAKDKRSTMKSKPEKENRQHSRGKERRSNRSKSPQQPKAVVVREGRKERGDVNKDFGATFPTPKTQSPVRGVSPTRRMVSEAIQTSPLPEPHLKSPHHHHSHQHSHHKHERGCPMRSKSSSPHRSKSRSPNRPVSRSKTRSPSGRRHKSSDRRNRSGSPGMFTPEGSDGENVDPVQPKVVPRPKPKPAEAWFVPLSDPRPWRKPLSEKQAFIDAMAAWPDKEAQRRKLQALVYGICEEPMDQNQEEENEMEPHVFRSNSSVLEKEEKREDGTLQDAFEKSKASFISKSRERQRIVKLRAEERRIQALHREHRQRLFEVKRKPQANLQAVPISELHYRPIKRKFTKKEMKEQTEKIYKKLPEVKMMAEEKKRTEAFKTNRLKAQLFKQPAPFVLRRCSPPGGRKKSSQSSSSEKRSRSPSLKPRVKKTVKKKPQSFTIDFKDNPAAEVSNQVSKENTNNKTNVTKNSLVVRNAGGNKASAKSKKKDKKKLKEKKKEGGELSLAAALNKVGIMPYFPSGDGKSEESGKKKGGSGISLVAAAQEETVTEIKTLYRFRYRAK